jgi:hypothetical protein
MKMMSLTALSEKTNPKAAVWTVALTIATKEEIVQYATELWKR